jgi:hypothetical protein
MTHNLKQLYKQQSNNTQRNSTYTTHEYRIIKQIKNKLELNEAIVSKADKGNSIIIIYLKDYHSKVQDFINHSNFTILKKGLYQIISKQSQIHNQKLSVNPTKE